MKGPYKKSDFTRFPLQPMPELSERISVSRHYSASEFKRISYGYCAGSMDEKWDIYLSNDKLYMHRSWTGRLIYIIQFKETATGYQAIEMTINRDPEQLKIFPIEKGIETGFQMVKLLLIDDLSRRLPEDWVD